MATVLNKPQTNAAKVEAKLSQELAQVTSRIRGTDLLSGGLTLLALVLGYTLVAVLADKLLDLPAWARLGGLGVFLAGLSVVAWFSVVRPLRSRINPRYAARQVEQTLSDGKNAVINWVDLQDQNLPQSVRAAVGARAAEGVADADIASVSESRRVLVPLASVGLLVAGLAVFFVLVKSAPFFSLLNRAYNPFTTSGIATRTVITLDEPAGDATVTSGDSLTVRVTLSGSLPDVKSPERPRLLVRYNPEAEEFDEIDLDTAGSKREFAAKLPPSVIQNGLRYRVAAGDARTPEYAVTVRTRPLLRDFTVQYEYPAYTRLQPETTAEPRVEGYRGTQVTLIARANRSVKDARLVFDGQSVQVAGVVTPESPDAASFRFVLDEPGNYRIAWTAADGEAAESAAYPIRLLVDQAPSVTITSPKEEEQVTLPADGLLKVDGVAADDFGLASVTLRLRVVGTPPVALDGKKYRDGKSFRRASDQSDPTVLEYKDSVKLSTLKTKSGDAVKLEPGSVVEYWLEATDNCAVLAANVGKSKVQRVTIAPPAPPAEQKQQEQNQADRGRQEQKHNADQDQQQGNEKRQPPQPRPDNVEKKPQDGHEKTQDGQPDPQDGKPPEGSQSEKGGGQKPDQGQSQKGANDSSAKPDQPPMTKPPESPEKSGEAGTPSKGDQEPPGKSPKPPESGAANPRDQGLQDQADKVQDALNTKQKQPSETRPPESNPDSGNKPPDDPDAGKPGKEKPQGGGAQKPPEQASEAKPQPGGEGQPKPGDAAADAKPQGGGEKATPEASQPKPDANSKSGDGGNPQPKPEPKTGQNGEPKPGSEKATTPEANPKSQDGGQGNDAKPMKEPQAGTGKPGDPRPGDPKPDATKGTAKPQPGAKSSQTEEKPGESAKPDEGQASSGAGKPQTPPKAGTAKPTPSDATKGSDQEAPKPAETPMDGGAGQAKTAGKPEPKADASGKPTAAGEQPKGGEKASDKPTPGGSGAGEKKPDAKELEQAIKDLRSSDPAKQQAARDKLDKALGKGNREAAEAKAEQLKKDLNGDDKGKQEAARREIEEMAKQAEKNGAAGGDKGDDKSADPKPPTPEQVKEAQKLQEDLTSKDDAKREAAEKKVDDAVGKEQREQIQQDLQDAQSGDQGKADAAKKRLEDRAKPKPGDQAKGAPRGPGPRPDTPGDKLDENVKNRRKTADLQLKNFEKAKGDADLQKKLGYTPEQYDEFLKGYRDLVQRQNDAAAKPETLPTPSEAGGPTTIRVGEGAGAKPLQKKADGSSGTAGGGVGTAPRGFSDAQRRFAEEAAKLRKPDAKK